jgi:hypothetical protein
MKSSSAIFVEDDSALERQLVALKGRRCPYCETCGTLNRHSRRVGNDPQCVAGQSVRGRRVFCSNRSRRAGCGRTFAILLCRILPRHTVTAPLVWKVASAVLAGSSIKAAWEASGVLLALETFYHFFQRFRRRLAALRTALFGLGRPPAGCATTDPLVQTLEHFRRAFGSHECPLAAFQSRFQRPLMG